MTPNWNPNKVGRPRVLGATPQQKLVLDALEKLGRDANAGTLAEAVGRSRGTVVAHLHALVRKGLLSEARRDEILAGDVLVCTVRLYRRGAMVYATGHAEGRSLLTELHATFDGLLACVARWVAT